MEEETELPENSYRTELSQSESHVPLSPVLGSGHSVRKLLKNRKRHRKGPSKVVRQLERSPQSIVEPEESGQLSKNNTTQDFQILEDSTIEQIPDPNNGQESIFDRIKKLDTLELKKTSNVKSLSFHTNELIEAHNLQSNIIEDTVIMKPQKIEEFSCKINSVMANEPRIGPIDFQTGSGKNITISDQHIKNSKTLFEDILGTSASQVTRKKKYNYLHKNKSPNIKPNIKNNMHFEENTAICPNNIDDLKCSPIIRFKQVSGPIRDGENFDNLNLKQNTSSKSVSRHFENNLNTKIGDLLTCVDKSNPKNIFEAENFDDLKLNENMGFKPASVVVTVRGKKSLFEAEHLNMLEALKNSDQFKTKPKIVKNIFEDENFDDMNLGHSIGFKPASICLGSLNIDVIKTREGKPADTIDEVLQEKSTINQGNFNKPCFVQLDCGLNSSSATFGNEVQTFQDLKNTCVLETTSTAKAEKPFKNIFDGENFNNLNLNFGDNLNTKIGDLPRLVIKGNSKNIFEGENFDDLNIGHSIGFKPASISLGSLNVDVIKTREGKPADTIGEVLQEKSTINQGNFNKPCYVQRDCELTSSSGTFAKEVQTFHDFKNKCMLETTSTAKAEKPFKNIFDGENFDNLNLNIGDNFNTKIGDLPRLVIKGNSKNIFEGENFDDLNVGQSIGFKPASNSLVKYKKSSIRSPNIDVIKNGECKLSHTETSTMKQEQGGNFDKLSYVQSNYGLKTSSATFGKEGSAFQEFKKMSVLETTNIAKAQKPFKNIFDGENFDDINVKFGLYSTNEKKFNTSNPKVFKNVFEGENFDDLNLAGLGPQSRGFTPLKTNVLHTKRPGNFQSPYRTPIKNIEGENDFRGFTYEEQSASVNISSDCCQISKLIIERFQSTVYSHNSQEPLVRLNDIKTLSRNITRNEQKLFLHCAANTANRKRKFSEVDSDHNSLCQKATPLQSSFAKRSKKRLGCHVSPTIQVSKTGLKRAKLMFDDLEPKPIETSTPLKSFGGNLARPLRCDLTPIQSTKKDWGQNSSRSTVTATNNNRFSLNKPSEGDVRVWLDNLARERRVLEERLRIVDEKQTILANQRTILDFSARGTKRALPGILYTLKNTSCRVALKHYVDSPGEWVSGGKSFLNEINPQNAHLVHFYICDKRQSHLKTEDGAIIVPNVDGRIGIAEIEHSFKLLEGVDPSLIPKGWIRNHYKWVVWKLASYERTFDDRFEGWLSVENVVQQLKYRYDVEIDKAQRPLLRKIFEKDDCPQRRMILCVSKIVKINTSYELELTDGWYAIRTVIDPPLGDQIAKGKIKLGVKLIVYGADIANCEGCHPLEASDLIYLKINYNATRRALWWCKLGYHRQSGPFPIPMSSVSADGGKIGCLRCFISRVYPVKYMERCADKNVWRNRKAEERREQDFYNERNKPVAAHSSNNGVSTDVNSYKNLRSLYDPEALHRILQRSGDLENLQEMLTASQRTILYNYTCSSGHGKPQQMRSVTSLLKIKVVDASCEGSDELYDFHVWRPGEAHLQELKEGEIVTIFNVSCSSKWGLSANQTTQFRREVKPKDERFWKFRRKVTYIEELPLFFKQELRLKEFDTAGLVIDKRIGDSQQVWMADSHRNLLLISIHDSPKNILALDVVTEGQIVSVYNLIAKHSFEKHVTAQGDHSVVFARYSVHKHLQDALERLEQEFENINRSWFINECKGKISQIEAERGNKSTAPHLDMDGMECSQITITDKALLECVEKLT